jgi:hypothetical protein
MSVGTGQILQSKLTQRKKTISQGSMSNNNEYDIVEPSAAAMIESLRAYGYSLNTAIADLIDNSISARTKNIWVHIHWVGSKSWISILDDGVCPDCGAPMLVIDIFLGGQLPRAPPRRIGES